MNFHRNCTKGKKFKMVAENVEKIQKIGKNYNKRAVLLSIHHWFKHLYYVVRFGISHYFVSAWFVEWIQMHGNTCIYHPVISIHLYWVSMAI